jgi:hypothetical protein
MSDTPPESGPFIHVSIRTHETGRAGTIPIGVYFTPDELEALRRQRLSNPRLSGPPAERMLVDQVLNVFDQVRDQWIVNQVRELAQGTEREFAEALNKIRYAHGKSKADQTIFREPYPYLTPDVARVAMTGGAWYAVVGQLGLRLRGLFYKAEDAQVFALAGGDFRIFILDSYVQDPFNYRGYPGRQKPPATDKEEVHWKLPGGLSARLIRSDNWVEFQLLHGAGADVNVSVDSPYSPHRRLHPLGSTCAEIVAAWASDPARTVPELRLAYQYLSRWPEGPQIPKPE